MQTVGYDGSHDAAAVAVGVALGETGEQREAAGVLDDLLGVAGGA